MLLSFGSGPGMKAIQVRSFLPIFELQELGPAISAGELNTPLLATVSLIAVQLRRPWLQSHGKILQPFTVTVCDSLEASILMLVVGGGGSLHFCNSPIT